MSKILAGVLSFVFITSAGGVEISNVELKEEFPRSAHDPVREQIIIKENDGLNIIKKIDLIQKEIDRVEELERILVKQEEQRKNKEEKARLEAEAKALAARTITFRLSFYSTLPEENGGWANMANGQPILGAQNVVASNYYPMGTKIYLEGFGTMTVSDRGGSDFNNWDRLDVLVQRLPGETDPEYRARIRRLGRQTTRGVILN